MTAEVDITEATDRSSPPPPMRMTKVCPILTIPREADIFRISFRFWIRMKEGEMTEASANNRIGKMKIPNFPNSD
jgi:hypothetical protein